MIKDFKGEENLTHTIYLELYLVLILIAVILFGAAVTFLKKSASLSLLEASNTEPPSYFGSVQRKNPIHGILLADGYGRTGNPQLAHHNRKTLYTYHKITNRMTKVSCLEIAE